MKRPISLLLLLVFAAVQLYFAKVPISHQVQGSSWIEVSRDAGGMVERQGHYYLVTPTKSFRLSANQVHITAESEPLHWVDVPEPSGAGVWRLATGRESLALLGIGGPVFPSPDGQMVAWIDPATRLAYMSGNDAMALAPLSSKMGSISQLLWSPDGQAVGLVGRGPDGEGAYVWDRDGNVSPLVITSADQTVMSLGFSQKNILLAALSSGRVLQQGRGILPLPALAPLFLDKTRADILGETANDVFFWADGKQMAFDRPDLKWMGRPAFSANGQMAAILSQAMGGQWQLLTYADGQHLQISLPFAVHTSYYLLGFLGSHWILVTVPSGKHAGTYGWWVQG